MYFTCKEYNSCTTVNKQIKQTKRLYDEQSRDVKRSKEELISHWSTGVEICTTLSSEISDLCDIKHTQRVFLVSMNSQKDPGQFS